MNNVLFEIGMEELPARFIDKAEKQLEEKTANWLKEHRIAFDDIQTYSTPRRLAVVIKNIASMQTSITEEVRGPQITVAKDENGDWTRAAIGFTKGQGKSTEDIYTKDIKGTEYIFIENHVEGGATDSLLPTFSEIITSLHFPQSMRWGTGTFRFPRPIRWIVALLDDQVIPFEVAKVKSSNLTYGHRFLGTTLTLHDPLQYKEMLRKQSVIVDPVERENMIVEQIRALEEAQGCKVVVDSSLLQEVRNLVEYPTAFYGSYSDDYLALPKEVLITSMQEHQRYFPVESVTGELLSYFVGVRNGNDVALENVVAGNEKVLRARLADGVFFYEEDKKTNIDFYINKLKTVVFQEKIGTIYEKLDHITQLSTEMNKRLHINEQESQQVIRAAEICKFDLMTNMVDEFTELQGIIGEYYALHFGEDPAVAQAIKEHYYPTHSNGKLATSTPGAIVGVADKLDTIVGSISVGLIPTGSQDPYSLRRQAIGVLRTTVSHHWNISIETLINETIALYPDTDAAIAENIATFFTNRAAHILAGENIEQDVINAVLHEEIGVFHYAIEKAKVLSAKKADASFKQIEQALVRVMNLGKKHVFHVVDPTLFQTNSEKVLYDTYTAVVEKYKVHNEAFNAEAALNELTILANPIELFFEENMVMTDDSKIRENRLAIIHLLFVLIKDYADLSIIEWKQIK